MGNNAAVYILKGLISELSDAEKAQVEEAAAKLREIVSTYGDCGFLALSLVANELGDE